MVNTKNGGQSDARRQMSVSLADVVQGTAPIVGDGVGQYLFVDLADNLVRLDLDSGEQHWFETSGSVVGVTEHHLIVVSNRNVFAVDAVEPETGGRFLYDLPGPVEPFWLFPTLLRMSDERVAITFTDLTQDISATGSAIVDSTGGPDDVTVVDYGRWWPAVPGLVSVPGAGVFDLFAPEPRKVFDGELVAGGAQRLIGVKCQDLDTCTTSLVARDTGEILVDDISAYGARPWQSRFIGPEDRLLVTWGEPDGRADPTRLVRIVDVESGEEVAPDFMDTGSVDLLSSAGPELLGSLDASSDSRLLATIGNNVVVIHDRVSETTVSINVEQGTRPGADPDRVFFVAKETS